MHPLIDEISRAYLSMITRLKSLNLEGVTLRAKSAERFTKMDYVFNFDFENSNPQYETEQVESGFIFVITSISCSYTGPVETPPLVSFNDKTGGREFIAGFETNEIPDNFASTFGFAGGSNSGAETLSEAKEFFYVMTPLRNMQLTAQRNPNDTSENRLTVIVSGFKFEVE